MIRRLPKWVEWGSFILAFIAGYVNVIGLLGFQHQSVSHLSGSATLLGAQLAGFEWTLGLQLIGVLICFVVGSAISGAVLCGESFKVGRHYDSLLILEAVLLILATISLVLDVHIGHYIASLACGLQNALATRYSGAVVRTTHVTGLFTDLGLMIGARLRGETFDKRKAKLFVTIIFGFISGGTVGAVIFERLEFIALLVPASLCLGLAFAYRLFFIKRNTQLYTELTHR